MATRSLRVHATITIVLLLTKLAVAAELHVAPSGSDADADGSIFHPYRTITVAAAAARPGDTVFVHDGVYDMARVSISAQGPAHSPITIRAFPGETPILDGTGAGPRAAVEAEDKSAITSVIDLRHARNIIVEGLTVRGSEGYGISTWESVDILVRHCHVSRTWSRALGGTGAHLTFEYNHVTDAVLMNENERILDERDHGIMDYWSAAAATWYREGGVLSRDVTFRGNTIENSWGEGIDALHVDGAVISGNTVRNTYSVLVYVDHSRNVTIEGNRLSAPDPRFIRRDTHERPCGVQIAAESYAGTEPIAVENIVVRENLITDAVTGVNFWRDPANTSRTNRYSHVTITGNTLARIDILPVGFSAIHDPEGAATNICRDNIIHESLLTEGSGPISLRLENPELWLVENNIIVPQP